MPTESELRVTVWFLWTELDGHDRLRYRVECPEMAAVADACWNEINDVPLKLRRRIQGQDEVIC